MSLIRQTDPIVRSYAVTHPPGDVLLPTQPGWDRIVYATAGLFVARTARQAWTVPPRRALCVADGVPIRLATRRPTAVRCLYFTRELHAFADPVRVIDVSRLTHELLLRAVDLCPLTRSEVRDSAIVTLLLAELADHPTADLHLALPSDPAALQVANRLLAEPSLALEDAVRDVPASRRTVERRFVAEAGMTMAAWQRRARVLAAIEVMVMGSNVTAAAAMVGYATPSSFVAAFRSELGRTPRAFMEERR